MTKYILAGGCDMKYPDFGKRLAEVVQREVAAPVILSCFFAQRPENWPAKRAQWQPWYEENFGFAKNIFFAEESQLLEQIATSDVVYFHGGETKRLREILANIEGLKEALHEKIIIGSSAGANFLARYAYSPSKRTTQPGSGILDLGVVVHYGIEAHEDKHHSMEMWHEAAALVRGKIGDRTLILLPEGDFTVIDAS